MRQCLALGTIQHGKWSYKTVVLYEETTLKNGKTIWRKVQPIAEATTERKINQLLALASDRLGLPAMPAVRHGMEIK